MEKKLYSLQFLGSDDLYYQIMADLKDLIGICVEKEHIPVYICVGEQFINVLVTRKLNKIKKRILTENSKEDGPIEDLNFQKIKFKLYNQFLEDNCIIKQFKNISIFVDPDEEYIALYYINTTRMAEKGELHISSGQPIEKVKYTDKDILETFNPFPLH